ncbi:unnamed protein product [Heligmosomoides polygyrus]|uniref:HTH_48 domain-containing protein n=1 Tax=Heligmosomoides polygyrus TaxID=6339 RepID=A0A183FNH6_HELPZ|nr:unnamed protein product [Heligmosomoides polygyrus]
MDQGRIRTFVYYEWLLGNDTGTAVANICRGCSVPTHSQALVQSFRERRHEPRGQGTPAEDHVCSCLASNDVKKRKAQTLYSCCKISD